MTDLSTTGLLRLQRSNSSMLSAKTRKLIVAFLATNVIYDTFSEQ